MYNCCTNPCLYEDDRGGDVSGGDGEVANEERKFDRLNETRFNFFVQSLSLRDYFVIYRFFFRIFNNCFNSISFIFDVDFD